jgi:hypothetical protein
MSSHWAWGAMTLVISLYSYIRIATGVYWDQMKTFSRLE